MDWIQDGLNEREIIERQRICAGEVDVINGENNYFNKFLLGHYDGHVCVIDRCRKSQSPKPKPT